MTDLDASLAGDLAAGRVEWYADLVAALGGLTDVARDAEADVKTERAHYSYRYSTLAGACAAARPVLAEHGVAAVQDVTTPRRGEVEIATVLLHRSGSSLRFGPLVLDAGRTAQDLGGAITYGRRYSLLASLGISSSTDDDDGAGASTAPARPSSSSPVEEPHPWELDPPHPQQANDVARWRARLAALAAGAPVRDVARRAMIGAGWDSAEVLTGASADAILAALAPLEPDVKRAEQLLAEAAASADLDAAAGYEPHPPAPDPDDVARPFGPPAPYESWTVAKLRGEAQRRGLDTTGSLKADLVDLLRYDDTGEVTP